MLPDGPRNGMSLFLFAVNFQQHPILRTMLAVIGLFCRPKQCLGVQSQQSSTTESEGVLPQISSKQFDGTNKTKCKKIHWRQGPPETTLHPSKQKIRGIIWRCQKTTSLSTWNSCPAGNQEVSEINQHIDSKSLLPKICERNCAGDQIRFEIPKHSCPGPSRGQRGLPNSFV